MELLVDTIEKETPTLNKNNVRLLAIGDISRMPAGAAEKLQKCINETASNDGLSLVLALSYSSRWEIQNAIKLICKDISENKIDIESINEETISNHLTTSNIPDPDLLIRTSGEIRISNFLLWQIAYTELYFTQIHWPDFRKENFFEAILNYQDRNRRFGK
jgi:undecaprenyl diphosphate synthase